MTIREHETVAALARAIAQRIGEPRYQLWFAGHTKFTWDEDELVVGVPNLHFQGWLEATFADAIRAAAEAVLGRPRRLRFAIDPELFRAARQAQAEASTAVPAAPPSRAVGRPEQASRHTGEPAGPQPAPRSLRPAQGTRRWHRLGDFVVGPCNRVAHASALSVVEAPGQVNPVVLHGPVGTGKTHLLEGIYVGLRKQHPNGKVCYATAEDFTNRFVQALRLGKLPAFRKHYRECDALLVDDLHFLATKRASNEEFLHTFDALQANGKQLVVTCDCHPRLAEEFSPELTDRLLGGAVWGLAPPEAETRRAILQAKAARWQTPVPDEVLDFLAERLRGNVRELEGALHTLGHYSRVAGQPVDLALAREALGELLRHAIRVVQLEDVERAVCQVLCLEAGALQARERVWAVSHPRMLAMYLARKHTAASYSDIGRHFGGRNHSTAVAAEKKIRQLLTADGELTLGERRLRLRDVLERVERSLGR